MIGAKSLVVKDVPAYAIVAGNPAEFLCSRFPADRVAALQRIAWWDWPMDRIRNALPMLLSGDIDGFIRTYDTSTPQSATKDV